MIMESAPLITIVINIAYASGSLLSLELKMKTIIKLIIKNASIKFFTEKNEFLSIGFHVGYIFNVFFVNILL